MEEEKEKKQKISNIEWGLLIGALAVIDLIQVGLDFAYGAGVLINRLIDILVALALLFIFWMKGIRGIRIFGSVAAAFGLEFIPVVDVLPLWTLDGVYAFAQDKIANKLPGLGSISKGLAHKAIQKGRETGQFPTRPQSDFQNRV